MKVADDVQIAGLTAGDRVTIVYTQAVVAEMIEQPKKKPAAKKSAPKK